jgi:hypothetical protein
MADIKISDLPVASSVSDADIVVINQGGATKTAARSLIKNAGTVTSVIAGTGLTGGTITGSGTIALSSPVSIANGGTGQTTYTDGQLLIGNTTGNTLTKATLTAGTGMTVTNGSGAITLASKGLGTRVKTVGIDAPSIQDCINLCTDADGEHPYTVLIPPIAGSYSEPLTLRGSVSLVGLTTSLNADAVQITGTHTFTPASAQANTNRINFQNLTFISGDTGSNTITCSSSTKYFSKLTFSGCIFSGNKADTYSHIKTDDNVSVYVDNCRFESSAGGSASAGITQGNGPLYLSNNTTFNVYGRAIDVPVATFPVTRTATVTAGITTMTLTSGDTTGLAVGMKISGDKVGSTVTIVSLTAPTTVVMSSPPLTSGSFTATFGQTPYVEIHDSVLAGKGAETVRLGNGLLTCNTSNFTNTATVASSGFAGSGINMLTGYVSAVQATTVGIVNSSFTISDTTAYTITGTAAPVFAALNGVSYSNGIPLLLYSTLIGANVTVYDYSARATSIENGGTGATTRQAALNALAGAMTANQVLAGNGTNITLRALASGDIPNLDTGKLTTGTLPVARGGTGATTLTGIIKGTGTTAMVAAAAADVATTLGSQTAATVYAAPAAAAGTPVFRALVAGDLPTVTVAKGGTGATDAATARTNLSAATIADVQIITSSQNWNKPANAKVVNIQIFGAGGGGGGGRKDTTATVARFGGGGGGGGGFINVTMPAAALGSSEVVTIGAGGTGGAGSSVTGNGTTGNNGNTTSFGTLIMPGGIGGGGGTSTTGTAGTAIISGSSGGASSATATASNGAPISATATANYGGPGGGAGGGLSTADAAFGGGAGGRSQALNQAGGAGGANTGAAGTIGYVNPTAGSGYFVVGSGGGGGGAGTTVSGGNGGAGGFPSAGGGGGGATISGTTSGAGGDGAAAIMIVTTYF